MIQTAPALTPALLKPSVERLFELSAAKLRSLEKTWKPSQGSSVSTVRGIYTSRAWTEWTQGFQIGSALLQFDATGDGAFLESGRRNTLAFMPHHVSSVGGHDHGFNNISTFGNLLRLAQEGKFDSEDFEKEYYRLALRVSGAVQAARWTTLLDGRGYIYSFQGPHSLFIDTLRSLRSLAVAHRLGQVLQGEGGRNVSLLERLAQHASVTAEYAVFYGEGRDAFDVRGRVAHESLFDARAGLYCCPSTQQGYSPFTTWTRGLAWAMLGFAEELEFLLSVSEAEVQPLGGRAGFESMMRRAAEAVCDYYLEQSPTDGIPYWDTGAPGLARLGDYLARPADPYNDYEPVDSSAATVAAQALWRLGRYLSASPDTAERGRRYRQAALTLARALFDRPYLSEDSAHQGLILHSVYHRPAGWDYVPLGRKIPCGEASMWGDYHARELALLLLRETRGEPYLTFFSV